MEKRLVYLAGSLVDDPEYLAFGGEFGEDSLVDLHKIQGAGLSWEWCSRPAIAGKGGLPCICHPQDEEAEG